MSITNRTLAQAIDESALFAVLDSATGTFTGATVVIGTEFMVQTGPTAGTQIPIRRGQSGTAALAHAISDAVQVGLSTDFTSNPVLATVFHDTSLTGDGSAGDPLSVVGGAGTVHVDAAGALDGDGSLLTPLAVITDDITIQVNGSNQLEVIGSAGASSLTVLTADPVSPTNDTAWIVRSGTSPGDSVTLKVRIAGATYELAGITLS